MEYLENLLAKRSSCRTVVDEAICFLTTGHMNLRQVLKHFKGLGSNRDFWIAYVNVKECLPLDKNDDTLDLLTDNGRPLLQDKELIVQHLCKLDSDYSKTVFDFLSEHLKNDEDVVRAFLEHSPYFCLTYYSPYVCNYPNLVANALQNIPLSSKEVSEHLSEEYSEVLSSNRSVVLAWARAGGYANPKSMQAWADDKEVLLEFLKHDSRELPVFRLSDRLAKDETFMMKVIKSNSKFFTQFSGDKVSNWDLSLAALADIRLFALSNSSTRLDLYASDVREVIHLIRSKLLAHKNFMVVLTAICSKNSQQNHFALRSLGPGKEINLKRIAEFLGIPMGEELRLLRRARKNLDLVGVH
jgi:hypothetical protein